MDRKPVMRSFAYALAPLLAAFLIAAPGAAQDETRLLSDRVPQQRPALLVLGSAHFENPGRDLVNVETPDIMSPTRQAEIEETVQRLTAFAPTHVAVEWPGHEQAALDARYREFLAGRYEPDGSEREQIGFRLAAAMGLDRVDAVDWNESPVGDLELHNWPAYADANGRDAELAAIMDAAGAIPPLQDQGVAHWLRELNDPAVLANSHRIYFDIAMIGDDQQQPGSNWVGHWYGRNLRIFRRLALLADQKQDRVAVVYGHGHAYLLRQFAVESGAFELVDVADVLPDIP
jgi:hypothetical protein